VSLDLHATKAEGIDLWSGDIYLFKIT